MPAAAAAATAVGPGCGGVGGRPNRLGTPPPPRWGLGGALGAGWGAKSIPGGWIQYPVRGFIPRLF